MSEAGHTWRQAFKGLPETARLVRTWTAGRITHEDAPLIADELFTAVLGTRPDIVEMTVSTAGMRARITASGLRPLPILQAHGPGAILVHALSHSSGITTDCCGLWAQLPARESK